MIGRGGREREKDRSRDRDRERDRESRSRDRDRVRGSRDYSPPRHSLSEDRAHHHHIQPPPAAAAARSKAPPSRHLWVGNLSQHTSQSVLSEHFLRFGELDSIAFQPGRSYAFVNFRRDEDAIIAMRALQGFFVAGLPLKIEFAKAERSSATSHDEHQQWRDQRQSAERGASLFPRDSRAHHINPEPFYPEKSKVGDKNAEPSEVLWLGFPAFLDVDETVLRRAFSPFGELVKVTAFPGRSYAFVQFRNVVAACRAKEALQGKLFNNPRVKICFAKNESGAPDHGRGILGGNPFLPNFNSNGHPGRSTEFRQDRPIGNSTGASHMGSPHFAPEFESGDPGLIGFGQRSSVWTGGSGGTFEPFRIQGPQSEQGLSHNMYERQSSPGRERGPLHHDFSPRRHSRKNPYFDDSQGLQDNAVFFREPKKLKTGPFPSDNELPEYPFSDSAQEKLQTGFSRPFFDIPEHEVTDNKYGSGSFGYPRMPEPQQPPLSVARPHEERDNNWNAPYDRFEAGSGSLPVNPANLKAFVSEPQQPPLSQEWKWEGTLAKGGSAICRARCFPVGKVMDTMLPEFLDCNARTDLDMLAKHFYQAANSWVVFFVPASDADMTLYNEFMHFLGEKQRVAVAKLSEKTTLFLVPPSEFSEKVLKVPGKLSISGVILRFQHPSSDFGSLSHPLEAVDSKLPSFQENVSYPMPLSVEPRSSAWGQNQGYPNSSSEPLPPPLPPFGSSRTQGPGVADFPMANMPGPVSSVPHGGPAHSMGRMSEPLNESGFFQPQLHQIPAFPSNWTPHHLSSSNSGTGNLFPQVSSNSVFHSAEDTVAKEHLVKSRAMQESTNNHSTPGNTDTYLPGSGNFSYQATKSQVPSSLPIPSLQPDQLAHLATLLGQREQTGSGPVSSLEADRKQPNPLNESQHTFVSSQKPSMQNYALSDSSSSHYGQVHQLLQQATNTTVPQTGSVEAQMGAPESQANQPSQNSGMREEETDPQRRLQATLQLAATLLQQIQQQAKGS